jgi:hypothetical protein
MKRQENKMAFSPEKPENPRDLFVYGDDEIDQAAILMYDSDDGLFYRDKGNWNEITQEDDWEFDTDGLIIFYVDPAFITRYDEAETANEPISLEEVTKYESAGPVEITE